MDREDQEQADAVVVVLDMEIAEIEGNEDAFADSVREHIKTALDVSVDPGWITVTKLEAGSIRVHMRFGPGTSCGGRGGGVNAKEAALKLAKQNVTPNSLLFKGDIGAKVKDVEMKGSVLQRLAAMQMNDINEEREEYQASQALARRMWRLKLSKMLKEWRNHVVDIRWGLNRITDVFARLLRRILKGVLQQWRDARAWRRGVVIRQALRQDACAFQHARNQECHDGMARGGSAFKGSIFHTTTPAQTECSDPS